MKSFSEIAPYLKDPLVLIGFVVLILTLLCRYIIKSGLLKPISGEKTFRVLRYILGGAFLFGLLIIFLGFGLKYRELSEQEQRQAVTLLSGEFSHNLATAKALQQNTITFLKLTQDTAKSLRAEGVPYVSLLFPAENVSGVPSKSPNQLAIEGIASVIDKGIDKSPLDVQKMQALVSTVRRTILNTLPIIKSLGDPARARYTIKNSAWESQLPILSKVHSKRVAEFQVSYQSLERLRADYDVVVASIERYLKSIDELFSNPKGLSVEGLSLVLTVERQTVTIIVAYSHGIEAALSNLSTLNVEGPSH
jgi:hypothetical protein